MSKIAPFLISEYQQSLKLRKKKYPYSSYIMERRDRNQLAAVEICHVLEEQEVFRLPLWMQEVTTSSKDSICSFLPKHFTKRMFVCDVNRHYERSELPLLQNGGYIIGSHYSKALEDLIIESMHYNQVVFHIGVLFGVVDDPYYQNQVEQELAMLKRLKQTFENHMTTHVRYRLLSSMDGKQLQSAVCFGASYDFSMTKQKQYLLRN